MGKMATKGRVALVLLVSVDDEDAHTPRKWDEKGEYYEDQSAPTTARIDPAGRSVCIRLATMAQDTQSADPTDAAPRVPSKRSQLPGFSEGEEVQGSEDIIVTGSRIPQPNLESAAPITVVSDQDVKLSGSTRIEDVLNQLPSVGAAQSSGVSNGATGAAEVDLRYLGAKRTLGLVNGRRLTPGNPTTGGQADLNLIPSSLVKRVEVLTGGASSVYGADAVAGVVNFIMDTLRGCPVCGNYSFWWHNQQNPIL